MGAIALKVYYDKNTGKIYGENSAELANKSVPAITYKSKVALSVQLIKSALITDVYDTTGVVAAEAAIDDDWYHYYEGALTAPLTGTIAAIPAEDFSPTPDVYETGNITLVNAAGLTETIAYTAYALANGVYTFTVSKTLDNTYAAGDICRIVAQKLVVADNTEIDLANIATGLAVVSLDGFTQPFQRWSQGKKEITGTSFALFLKDVAGDDIIPVIFPFRCLGRMFDFLSVPPAPDDYLDPRYALASTIPKLLTLTSHPTPTTALSTIDAAAPVGSWGIFGGYKYTWTGAATVVSVDITTSWSR